MGLVEWGFSVAEQQLARELPLRPAHVLGVARRAITQQQFGSDDLDLLTAAAVLRDVGYAPALVTTGFHPLDGATLLREQRAPDRLVNLGASFMSSCEGPPAQTALLH